MQLFVIYLPDHIRFMACV